MRKISDLNKEEKLIELSLDIQTKQSMGQIMGSHNPMYVSDSELEDLLEDVIDNIWYITSSPNFEFERNMFHSDSIIVTKKDIDSIFNKFNKDKVFIWYNLTHTNNQTNHYMMSSNQTSKHYIMRGKFVDNRQYLREKKISQILEE